MVESSFGVGHICVCLHQIATGRLMWEAVVFAWLSMDNNNTKAMIADVINTAENVLDLTVQALGRGMATQ